MLRFNKDRQNTKLNSFRILEGSKSDCFREPIYKLDLDLVWRMHLTLND